MILSVIVQFRKHSNFLIITRKSVWYFFYLLPDKIIIFLWFFVIFITWTIRYKDNNEATLYNQVLKISILASCIIQEILIQQINIEFLFILLKNAYYELHFYSGIKMDKTMIDKLMQIPNDNIQNYSFWGLRLEVDSFEHST